MASEIVIKSLKNLDDKVSSLRGLGNDWIYRGLSDICYNNESSLYREDGDYSVKEYMDKLDSVYDFCDSIGGIKLPRWSRCEINDSIESLHGDSLSKLAFARHFGYRSPLLDWSNNPHIALFFAVSQFSDRNKDGVLYCFNESLDNTVVTFSRSGTPKIKFCYPSKKNSEEINICENKFSSNLIKTGTKRVVSQESIFSMAVFSVHSDIDTKFFFGSHEKSLNAFQTDKQYCVKKMIVPYSVKAEILFELSEVGISFKTLYLDTPDYIFTSSNF